MKKKVSVTLSAFILSVLSGNRTHVRTTDRGSDDTHADRSLPLYADEEGLRLCKAYRRSFPMTEIAFPAKALSNRAIAKWVRDQRVTVDVQTGDELAAAIATGVQLRRLTVYADALSEPELRATVDLGVGRLVISSVQHIELLRCNVAHYVQDVVIRMTDANTPFLAIGGIGDRFALGFRFDSNESDRAIAAILDHEWLNLVGLHCDVGSQDHDFVSYPAAIGHMIAEMAHVHRSRGVVLTRLGLGGGRAVLPGDWAVELPQLARQVDDSLDDACGALRFPRPLVVLSAGLDIIERNGS